MWQLLALAACLYAAQAQLTAQTSVAPELRECYLNASLVNRNNLPPASIEVLIDIIRKIEDNPNVNMDLRQIATVLLHTYRQDGIEYHQPESILGSSGIVLPYAPTFHSFHRHRLLLTKIIPNNLQVLANTTIPAPLKCALHYMLSTTVDARLRGNEGSCQHLSQYRAMRTGRQAPSYKDDVEIMDSSLLKSANKRGQMRQNPKLDVEYSDFQTLSRSERQLLGESTCPILGGVVDTRWGAVSAGNLLAGIAAGAELQQVPVTELIKGSVVDYQNIQRAVTSLYPATLSGDLAEAILIQGTERGAVSISIGTDGNWNSTEATKFYMIHSRTNVEMTDPEIRGGIDGFVIGANLRQTLNTYSSLKLSQLLDMYYSPRNGIYDVQTRACNRKQLAQQIIANDQLVSETYTFAAALDSNLPLKGTLTNGLESLVQSAVTNFQTYTTSNLNDLSCVTTEDTSLDYRTNTNLYIVVDSTWQYQTVYPAISYLLDGIEVGKFGSSVTLLNAASGSVVINKTFSLADFHSEYTQVKHQSMLTGVNLQASFANIKEIMHQELRHERSTNYIGGNSSVLLFLLTGSNLQNNEQVWQEARELNETVPDLRILFATTTNQMDNVWNLVKDMHKDIKTVNIPSDGTNAALAMSEVLERIEEAGRRVINPVCGPEFASEHAASGTRQFEEFIEPGYINFYAISPNYFYQDNEYAKIRVVRTGAGTGSFIICHSRVVSQPRQNATVVGLEENAIVCQTLASTGNVEMSLHGACDGHWTIGDCPKFYFSVQHTGALTSTVSCSDNHCRFPYSIRYQIQIDEFRCYSNGMINTSSFILIAVAIIYNLF